MITYGVVLGTFILNSSNQQQEEVKRSLTVPMDEVYSRAVPPLVVPVKPFFGSTKPPTSVKDPPIIRITKNPVEVRKPDQRPAISQGVEPVSTVVIVKSLLALAKMPYLELQHALNTSGDDVFSLGPLDRGECKGVTIDFLPKRPSAEAAKIFRERGVGSAPTMVWYEHLSKAGGTSFCKLAKKNMKRKEIPAYYCMPSEPGMPDARVGQWANDKLGAYLTRTGEVLVSNEWEPFPLARLDLQTPGTPLNLVFVTSIRDPLNRLLSAYRFWGVLHNPAGQKPPAKRWLRNMEARALADSKSPRGMGKGVGTGRDFIARVGMPNFATWKFSGGEMPVLGNVDEAAIGEWSGPLEVAINTLARFDLVIPMELLSKHPEPLGDLLGWKDFSETHVVPSGKVVNNDASTELGDEESLQKLWAANKLDILLYTWVKAVYLARINCKI